ncbi:MAG: hypothetical protein CMP26_02195 [Roseibacillus sp.]|nr:hypothetical protein [Roseibacillus sp.]
MRRQDHEAEKQDAELRKSHSSVEMCSKRVTIPLKVTQGRRFPIHHPVENDKRIFLMKSERPEIRTSSELLWLQKSAYHFRFSRIGRDIPDLPHELLQKLLMAQRILGPSGCTRWSSKIMKKIPA